MVNIASSLIAAPSPVSSSRPLISIRPAAGGDIEVAAGWERQLNRLSRGERGAEHACIGADRQGVVLARRAAGEGDERPRTVGLREGAGGPARRAASKIGLDPDLEESRRLAFRVELGVADAGARAHHLHVAGGRAAVVAQAVAVADRTPPDIGDDLHIGMAVERKAGARGDLVVVPDAQATPAHSVRIGPVGEGEVIAGVQPVVAKSAQSGCRATLDHALDSSVEMTHR